MKKLIEYIIKSIVSQPEKVNIEESVDKETGLTQLMLSVAEEDIGKVIGKKGRIIKAVRSLLRIKLIISGQKAVLILKEEQSSTHRTA